MCVCVCTVFFRFFSILGYYKILDLEGNILSEISQIEEGKIFCDLTYIWNVKKPKPIEVGIGAEGGRCVEWRDVAQRHRFLEFR